MAKGLPILFLTLCIFILSIFSVYGATVCDSPMTERDFCSSEVSLNNGNPTNQATCLALCEVAGYTCCGMVDGSYCWGGVNVYYEGRTSRMASACVVVLNPQTITSTNAVNITKYNVTLTSSFTYEDANWINAYFVLNGVNQTKTNYTTATTHNQTITGLDIETYYTYRLCLDSDIETAVCSATKNFTTSDRTAPYINIANAFNIEQTTASVGGTFFFEDFTNITAYVKLDGVNQTQTLYATGVSQYHSEVLSGLDHSTNYTWDFCISYENGEICEGGGTFETLDYTPPSINIVTAFNITNHEAYLGATILWNDFLNMTLQYYIDDFYWASEYYDKGVGASVYYLEELLELDYSTTYDYRLDIIYLDPHNPVGASDTNWLNEYRLNTTSGDLRAWQLTDNTGDHRVEKWDSQDDRQVLSSNDCVILCNKFYGDPELNSETAVFLDGSGIPFIVNATISDGAGTCWYIDSSPYDECYVGGDGTFIAEWESASSSYAQTMNQTIPLPRTITGVTKNFTTEDPYPPYITISNAINIVGTTVTLTGTYYYEDYPNTLPFFRLDGTDLFPKTNITLSSEPYTFTYDLTGLSTNTTYNYTFCVGYSLGWALSVCDTTKTFTTGFEPSVIFHAPTLVNANDVTLHWTINYDGTTNVSFRFLNSDGGWIPALDGYKESKFWDNLLPETNYTYYLQLKYDTLGTTHYLNTSNQYVTTYYENAFDDVWDTLFQGSAFAKLLLGFVVLLAIIFFGATAFGRYNLQLGVYGFLILAVIGTGLATLMKLFSTGIMLLIFVGLIILVVLKNMFFNDNIGDGR